MKEKEQVRLATERQVDQFQRSVSEVQKLFSQAACVLIVLAALIAWRGQMTPGAFAEEGPRLSSSSEY
jgi:hypothetical protein